jgi:NitT/TauT family transport system ATP-binding protein
VESVLSNTSKIECRGVKKYYGGLQVLSGVDLQVEDKEFHTLLGPSGCGKTTLLRIMGGLTAYDGGSVMIDGERVTKPQRKVAMVFQQSGLFPWKTLYDNVAFGLLARGADKEVIDRTVPRYLEMVGLRGFEKSFPYQLSGGMKQRGGLARALAVQPEILLMDEPFAAVDAQTREMLQGELLDIWERERKTVVFVTHSIDEAIVLSDVIWVMATRPGRIIERIRVNLPRPREENVIRVSREYQEIRQHIWEFFSRAVS